MNCWRSCECLSRSILCMLIATALLAPRATWSDDGGTPLVVPIKRLSLDAALRIARASIDTCRKGGVQVAVTVVDRGGHPQVVLRDVLAPDVTLTVSHKKAYTAMAFNATTSSLEGRFTNPFSVAKVEALLMSAGGVPIQAGGVLLGGVGVSGAPSGKTDEECANAGVQAIAEDLEFLD